MTHDSTTGGRGRYRRGDADLPWTGERQVGRTLADIRPDHVARYTWATQRLPIAPIVLDAGCGVGYGSSVLARKALRVEAVDVDQRTIEYAQRHWAHPHVEFHTQNLMDPEQWDGMRYHAIVALEVLEHVDDLPRLLTHFAHASQQGTVLLASTPNQTTRPYKREAFPFHHRHYTRAELSALLTAAGFTPRSWFTQHDAEVRPLEDGADGDKFLLVMAVKT